MIQVSNSSVYLNFLVTKFLINSKTFLLTVHPNANYYIFSRRLFHWYLIGLFYEKDYRDSNVRSRRNNWIISISPISRYNYG